VKQRARAGAGMRGPRAEQGAAGEGAGSAGSREVLLQRQELGGHGSGRRRGPAVRVRERLLTVHSRMRGPQALPRVVAPQQRPAKEPRRKGRSSNRLLQAGEDSGSSMRLAPQRRGRQAQGRRPVPRTLGTLLALPRGNDAAGTCGGPDHGARVVPRG